MNLEYLDFECFFLGIVYNLLVYNLISIFCLKCYNQIFFFKNWKFKVQKKFVFLLLCSFWGRLFEKTNCLIFIKFDDFMFLGV